MLRDTILAKGFSGFLASLLFWVQPAAEIPDLRHWSDQLSFAVPSLADFEAYMSEQDEDASWSELKDAATERQERLAKLDEAADGEGSQGQIFRIQRERVSILQEDLVYRRLQREQEFFQKSNHWRALDMDRARLAEKDQRAHDIALKILNITRDIVKQFPFEEDTNSYLLIRAMVRVQHSNTNLFFEQFKKKFPQSPHAPLVYHVMAEGYAAQKNWQAAEDLLKQAIEFKESPARPYSIFRLAWLHIEKALAEADAVKKAETLDKAVAGFRLATKLLHDKPQKKGLFPLANQATIDLAWTFALQKKPEEEVREFFAKAAQPLAFGDYLYYSALEADRAGDFPLAESLWQKLAEQSPLSLERPRILLNQAEHARLKGDQPAMLSVYKQLQALGEPENPWAKEFSDRPEEGLRVKQWTAHHLSYAAQMAYLAGEALPEGKARAQALASSEELYKLYGEWYPEGSAREEGTYYKALSLYFKGMYQDSLKLLSTIADNEKSPLQREASYNAVLVAAAFDEKQKLPKLPPLGQAKKPTALTPSKEALLQRTETYLKRFPDAQEKAPFEYMLAQMFFEFGNYAEAVPRFTSVIMDFPATEQGETSLHTLLQYYVETMQWDVLIPLCEEWMKNKTLRAAGHRKILRQTLEYARTQKP